jgi:hypothetical protein
MTKIYIIAAVALAVAGSYWAGGRVASERCRAESAERKNESDARIQSEIINAKAKINEETYRTGAADIRMRLRADYTIRD